MKRDVLPLVSVVMPSYNGSKFIEGSLHSALTQEYPNMEFIVVNDGSTDDTKDIIERLQTQDERIVVINNSNNQGISRSRNLGMEAAKGKYIAVLDSDDQWIDAYKTAKQVALLESHKDIRFLGTHTIIRRENTAGVLWRRNANQQDDEQIRQHLIYENPFCHSSVMFRNMYATIGGYPEHVKHTDDYAYRLKAARYTKFANMPEYATLYNSHLENTSHQHYMAQKLESIGLSRAHRHEYPNGTKQAIHKASGFLYSFLSQGMEKYTPLLKDEIRRVLGRPTMHDHKQQQEIMDLVFTLQNR